MSIPVVIFTFSGDHACAVMAAKSALNAKLGPIFVEVQEEKPLPPATREMLVKMGCHVREVGFKRYLNMRGLENFLGMCDSYDYVFAATGARHLIKLDSDTYIIDPRQLHEAVNADVLSAAPRDSKYSFLGWCCVLSRRLLLAMRDFLGQWGGFPGWDNRAFPEDKVIGAMSHGMPELGETRIWPFDPAGSFGAGWRYAAAGDTLAQYAAKYDVVTFGNRHLIPGKKSSCAKRDDVALAMFDFHKLITAA